MRVLIASVKKKKSIERFVVMLYANAPWTSTKDFKTDFANALPDADDYDLRTVRFHEDFHLYPTARERAIIGLDNVHEDLRVVASI